MNGILGQTENVSLLRLGQGDSVNNFFSKQMKQKEAKNKYNDVGL